MFMLASLLKKSPYTSKIFANKMGLIVQGQFTSSSSDIFAAT